MVARDSANGAPGLPCNPFKSGDRSTVQCIPSKCIQASRDCRWCRCKGCSICAAGKPGVAFKSQLQVERSFPSHSGRWDCTGTKQWHASIHDANISGVLNRSALDVALRGRWIVLMGDSSIRMLFHFLVGVLSLGWTSWPAELSHGHPPGWPAEVSCLDNHDNSCVQEAFLQGTRLTCAWYDYNDDRKPPARLQALADDSLTTPDVVIASIGAWHVMHRRNSTDEYDEAVWSLLTQIDRMLFPRRNGTSFKSRLSGRGVAHKIFAATTSCARAWPKPDGPTHTVHRLNRIAFRRVMSAQGWSWFDREAVVGTICMENWTFPDCAGFGKHVSSRFHPAGRALNVLVNLLADRFNSHHQ